MKWIVMEFFIVSLKIFIVIGQQITTVNKLWECDRYTKIKYNYFIIMNFNLFQFHVKNKLQELLISQY